MIYVAIFILTVIASIVFIIRSFALIVKFFNWLYPIVVIGIISVVSFLYISSLKTGDITNIINNIGDYLVSIL